MVKEKNKIDLTKGFLIFIFISIFLSLIYNSHVLILCFLETYSVFYQINVLFCIQHPNTHYLKSVKIQYGIKKIDI